MITEKEAALSQLQKNGYKQLMETEAGHTLIKDEIVAIVNADHDGNIKTITLTTVFSSITAYGYSYRALDSMMAEAEQDYELAIKEGV